jgi:SAM-dependent methyltransferase
MGWSDDAAKNRELWTKANDQYTRGSALASWNAEPRWSRWHIPETKLGILGDVAGLDAVELGCGTAYVSAWLARAGARPVGVDITPAQLETARQCMAETGIEFPLVEADAAETGLPDASADLVISEYGAATWVDPYRWIPEASRLLRQGGRLVFMCGSTLSLLCAPDEDEPARESLQRPQRGMGRFDWPDGGVEFHLGHGEMIDLLHASGFELVRLVELYAPDDARDHEYYDSVSADWAKKWPSEELWTARKAPLVGADLRSAGFAGAPSASLTRSERIV